MMKHAVHEWPKKMHGYLAALASLVVLTGCNPSASDEAPLTATTATLSIEPIKQFHFEWQSSAGASHYRLLENPDGQSGFTQVGNDIPSGTTEFDLEVPLYARVNAQYIVQSCNTSDCKDSNTLAVTGNLNNAIGYVKASDPEKYVGFGSAVALDQAGQRLVVGGYHEDEGDSTDSVYVFRRDGALWVQEAHLKGNHTETQDFFGKSVDLSADGDRLVVAAEGEDSSATGVNGDESNNGASGAGAVYVFHRTGTQWVQEAYLKASNAEAFDSFGDSVSLSADGDRLAVGAENEGSSATGVNGNEGNNAASGAGAIYVFHRTGTDWVQEAYVKASNTDEGENFGRSVSFSANGDRLAVGAANESSNAVGINGDESNNHAPDAGAVYVFHRTGTDWAQEAYVKASNSERFDFFGRRVSLNGDGTTLAVGAFGENGDGTGVNSDQINNGAEDAGAVYVFHRTGTDWAQQAYLKASNTGRDDNFGRSVSLSADGDRLAVGAESESSNAIGVNGDQNNNAANKSGAVYVFQRTGTQWVQQAYLKASNSEGADLFGYDVSFSGDGSTLAAGAYEEDSNATGVQGDQLNNSEVGSGAVYLY